MLVNNPVEQCERPSLPEVTEAVLDRVFRTNIFSYFLVTKHALRHMGEGGSIINTSSVNAYKGNKTLLDYTSTKGAIVAFTRALALQLAEKGIRVNGVAPGPVWTPLIPASFGKDKVGQFGSEVPMKRAGQPAEVAPSFVFLASEQDSSYMSGQFLHVNGMYVVHTYSVNVYIQVHVTLHILTDLWTCVSSGMDLQEASSSTAREEL